MRRAISFIFASGLLLAGGYILFNHLAHAQVIRGIVLLAAGSMIGIGGYWLWTDFVAPYRNK